MNSIEESATVTDHFNESHIYDYVYYDESDPDKFLNAELFTDVCHEFEFSVFFLIVYSLNILCFVTYLFMIFKKRNVVNGLDIIIGIMLLCAIIKFTPRVYHNMVLHGHEIHMSQTKCKISAYTTVGMMNVISYLVMSLLVYAWFSMTKGVSDVDRFVKKYLGWLVLLMFAFQGVAGMTPAMYIDLDEFGESCNATQSMDLSHVQFVTSHLMLFAFVPFIVPFLLAIFPLYKLTRRFYFFRSEADDSGDEELTTNVITILMIVYSYIIVFLPVTIMNLIVFPATLNGVEIHWITLCHLEGVFIFFQDLWFSFVPLLAIWRDLELSRNLHSKTLIKNFLSNLFRRNNDATSDRVRLE